MGFGRLRRATGGASTVTLAPSPTHAGTTEQQTMAIPNDPETMLTRKQLAAALTDAGYPTSPATLATKASRGGGPPFCKFGARALHPWGLALEWARSKLGPVVTSTSELDKAREPERKATDGSAIEREAAATPHRQAKRSRAVRPAADLTPPSAA
jgi:hypothetical protein